MFYRENGQLKTSYAADMVIFPVDQDRWGFYALLIVVFAVLPFSASEHFLGTFMIPVLIWSLSALGLNVLVGYCGQLSLGHGGFMAVGAYAAYNFATRVPELNILVVFILSGLCAAVVGMIFALPCLRLQGFYVAIATLAAQFTIEFVVTSFSWFTGDNAMGVLDSPEMVLFGYAIESVTDHYYLVLCIVCILALLTKNLVRGPVGRSWMAIRDMEVAAEIIGIRRGRAKLLAFAVSYFFGRNRGRALYLRLFENRRHHGVRR